MMCFYDIGICSDETNPCDNGGQCSLDTNSTSGYTCTCPGWLSGDNCTIGKIVSWF